MALERRFILISTVLLIATLTVVYRIMQHEKYMIQNTVPSMSELFGKSAGTNPESELAASKPTSSRKSPVNLLTDACCQSVQTSDCRITLLNRTHDGGCPDRYLTFNYFGNLNNAIIQLSQALYLGSVLDRTVLLTPEIGVNWAASVELDSDLCVRVVTSDLELKNLLRESNQSAVKSIEWDDVRNGLQRSVPYQMEWVKLDVDYLRKIGGDLDGYIRLNCIAHHLPHFTADRVISIARPFFTGRSKEAHMSVLRSIKPATKRIRDLTDRFLNEKVQGKPFVGLHLRWFEGMCDLFSQNHYGKHPPVKKFLSEAQEACTMRWDYISRLMKQAGFDPDTTLIFLATDSQRPALTKGLLKHPNVFMWPGSEDKTIDGRLVDLYALTKSSLLIGHPVSTFTFNAALWREIDGWKAETNALPAYRELGYLAHLFNAVFDRK